jgi:cytochrome c oxidase subunit 2
MNTPLSVLHPAGSTAERLTPLLWGLIGLSIVVVLIIAAAVALGLYVRTRTPGDPRNIAPEHSPRGLRWIWAGTGISIGVLLVFVGWTFTTMAGIAEPPRTAALVVDVSAAQWWWQFTYEAQGNSPGFVTANELHIPVGVPVRLRLGSPDVIHSFWVPALGGKTDAIPGQVNETWLDATKPGIYRGQCSEFCGPQHAQMALLVVAEPQAQFDAWRAAQGSEAAPPGDARGEAQFVLSCGECHTVRGTGANGKTAPDLTHVMSRATLAAGMLANNRGNLAGWIANPQSIKPGARMPAVPLSGRSFEAILNYVSGLR